MVCDADVSAQVHMLMSVCLQKELLREPLQMMQYMHVKNKMLITKL